jgi:spermidine/putrescine transport system permease protein
MSRLALRRTKARIGTRRGLLESLGPRLLSANVLLMFAFLYVPIFVLIVFSFNAATVLEGGRVLAATVWKGFTLHWYEVLIHDARIIDAVNNTLVVAIISTFLSTVMGTMAALVMERQEFFGKLTFD